MNVETFIARQPKAALRAFLEARDARTLREFEASQDGRMRARLRAAYDHVGVGAWPALANAGNAMAAWRAQCTARLHAFVRKVRKLHPAANTPSGFAHLAAPQFGHGERAPDLFAATPAPGVPRRRRTLRPYDGSWASLHRRAVAIAASRGEIVNPEFVEAYLALHDAGQLPAR